MFTYKRKRPSRLYLNDARCHIAFTVTSGGLMKADRLPLSGQEGYYAYKYWWNLVKMIYIDHYITYCNILVSKWGKYIISWFMAISRGLFEGAKMKNRTVQRFISHNTRWRSDTVKTCRTLRHFLCAPDRLHGPCAADCFCCVIYIYLVLVIQIKSSPKSK